MGIDGGFTLVLGPDALQQSTQLHCLCLTRRHILCKMNGVQNVLLNR